MIYLVLIIMILAIEYHFKPRLDFTTKGSIILWYNELGRTSNKRTYKKWKY